MAITSSRRASLGGLLGGLAMIGGCIAADLSNPAEGAPAVDPPPVIDAPADPLGAIWAEASAQGIPPRDIGGLISKARCESRMRPNARPRGVWGPAGLFQIIPSTYNDLAARHPWLGLPPVSLALTHPDDDPRLDPVINARAAARLFIERGYQPWTVGGC